MDNKQKIKSNQEQAISAWISYLNQVRLERLSQDLSKQDVNLEEALSTIDNALEIIQNQIIERNRGALRGMHGFIAEVAECGIGNATRKITGDTANYSWVNDNGPIDFLRDGIQIQQKFVESEGKLSLKAIKRHLSKYPDFLENGGKYNIPKDHYEKIMELWIMPKEIANKMPTSIGQFSFRQWNEVHETFGSDGISIEVLEPSFLDYDSVQSNRIGHRIEAEKESLSEKDKVFRKAAHQKSLPTLHEGAKVTLASAVIEGGTDFYIGIAKKRRDGKAIKDFDESDWTEIGVDTGKGLLTGGIRGVSVYAMTNFTATPAAIASSIVTAAFGIAEQVHQFRNGAIDELAFIENSELLCLDVTVSALSSLIGQAIIPIPVLGTIIGNTVGTTMYEISKDAFERVEHDILCTYAESLQKLDNHLDDEYKKCVHKLHKNYSIYIPVILNAFSPDVEVALVGSVKLAESLGVQVEEILDTPEKITSYFID